MINTDSDSDNNNNDLALTSPKRKQKRLCCFNVDWLQEYSWLRKHESKANTFGTVCRTKFSIAYKGYSALRIHESTKGHQSSASAAASSRQLDSFFVKSNSLDENKVCLAEIVHIYHNVKHNLSYNSLDCNLKLVKLTFNDSNIAKKISCGRTKSTKIVENVLAPYIIENLIENLIANNIFFGVQTDASNRKNRKFFPICIQFFNKQTGIQNKIIDFIENSNETALSMSDMVKTTLKSYNLNINNVVSLSADNTNANFGKHNSLFTHLKTANKNIVKANCHAHILYNALKKSLDNLNIDVENIILKIYSHFSNAAKRREKLVEFCNFAEIEFKEILRHVTTRWLSLLPAIDRILITWSGLTSYFLSEDLSKQMKNILLIKDNEIPPEIELYLTFLSHILKLYSETTKKLESNICTAMDLYHILVEFKDKLSDKIVKNFFGYQVRELLLKITNTNERNSIENDFKDFINITIKYIEQIFDFSENNWLYKISKVSLQSAVFNFDDMLLVIEELNLKNILSLNIDKLFEEMCIVEKNLGELGIEELSETNDKFIKLFKHFPNMPNVLQIISYLMSIPSSSAFTERIFSAMNAKWSEERNRCSTKLIKSELIISFNQQHSCSDFFELIKNDSKLIKLAKNNEKYNSM